MMKNYLKLIAWGTLCCAALQSCDNQKEESEPPLCAAQQQDQLAARQKAAREWALEKHRRQMRARRLSLLEDSKNADHFDDVKQLLIRNIQDQLLKTPDDIFKAENAALLSTRKQCRRRDDKIVNGVLKEFRALHAKEPFDFGWFGSGHDRMKVFLKEHPQVRNHYDLFFEDLGLRVSRDESYVRKYYRTAVDLISVERPFMNSLKEYKAFLSAYSQAKGIPFADEDCMTQKEIKAIQEQYARLIQRPKMNVLTQQQKDVLTQQQNGR